WTGYGATSPAAPQRSCGSRRGAGTDRLPKRRAGTSVSHTPIWIFRAVSARKSIASGCGASGGGADRVVHVAAARTSASPATAENGGAVPVYDATAPSTGPNIAPAIAT